MTALPIEHGSDHHRRRDDTTAMLQAAAAGDASAWDAPFLRIYSRLLGAARRELNGFPRLHHRAPESLVHEAYAKLVKGRQPAWQSVDHLRGCLRRIMWQICIDWIRKIKRHPPPGTLQEWMEELGHEDGFMLLLDDALDRLEQIAPRAAEVFRLRYIERLTVVEAAERLGICKRLVVDEYRFARAFLHRELA